MDTTPDPDTFIPEMTGELWRIQSNGSIYDGYEARTRDEAARLYTLGGKRLLGLVMQAHERLGERLPPAPEHLGRGQYQAFEWLPDGSKRPAGRPFRVYRPQDVSQRGQAEGAVLDLLAAHLGEGVLVSQFAVVSDPQSYLHVAGRADAAHFDTRGGLHGFEVKTRKDTLSRLAAQVALYAQTFDTVTLVAAANHIEAALRELPLEIGVLAVTPDGLQRVRDAQRTRPPEAWRPLTALQYPELVRVAAALGLKTSRQNFYKLVQAVSATAGGPDIRQAVRDQFTARTGEDARRVRVLLE